MDAEAADLQRHSDLRNAVLRRSLENMVRPARVVAVEHLGALSLRVTFSDNLVRELDFTGVVGSGVLAPLEDPDAFAQVFVDAESGTIAWPGDIDLDPDVLHGDYPAATGRAPRVLREYRLRPTG